MDAVTTHRRLMLVSDVLAIGASIVILYKLTNQGDAGKLLRMRAARATAHMAKEQVNIWSDIALRADNAYWRIANVTS